MNRLPTTIILNDHYGSVINGKNGENSIEFLWNTTNLKNQEVSLYSLYRVQWPASYVNPADLMEMHKRQNNS